MFLTKSSNDEEIIRAGKEYRVNPERYFHVLGQGWYVLVREGVSGPYRTQEKACVFIQSLIKTPGDGNKVRLRIVER